MQKTPTEMMVNVSEFTALAYSHCAHKKKIVKTVKKNVKKIVKSLFKHGKIHQEYKKLEIT